MRDFKGMKRQRGRNRGGGSGGGKPNAGNANRAFDSNGPDGVKIRGNPQHIYEKYQQLSRDAASSGDRRSAGTAAYVIVVGQAWPISTWVQPT